MVYAEKYVGFWLSFLLPTLMLCKVGPATCLCLANLTGLCPLVIFACKKRYRLVEPTGSVLATSIKLWKLAMKNKWSWNPVTL
jgi:POT family proton-dependent oligopeptide transporter